MDVWMDGKEGREHLTGSKCDFPPRRQDRRDGRKMEIEHFLKVYLSYGMGCYPEDKLIHKSSAGNGNKAP